MNDDNEEKKDTNSEPVTHDPNSMDAEMGKMDEDFEESDVDAVPANWIKIVDGQFVCGECENKSAPETNTEEGTVAANLEQITKDLQQFPTKIIYGVCPVCGMEYTFRLKGDDLYLEPSDLEK